MSQELINYYRGWPASLADDFDLYWRISHYRNLDWKEEFAYWSDGSLRKRPHKGKRFSQKEYSQALISLYAPNWLTDPRFSKIMEGSLRHQNVA